MKDKQSMPKKEYEELYFDEVEFSKEADRLIEAIRQRRIRLGKDDDKKETLKAAHAIIERRLA